MGPQAAQGEGVEEQDTYATLHPTAHIPSRTSYLYQPPAASLQPAAETPTAYSLQLKRAQRAQARLPARASHRSVCPPPPHELAVAPSILGLAGVEAFQKLSARVQDGMAAQRDNGKVGSPRRGG